MGENPVRFMMSHEKIILDTYKRSGGPKKAWDLLQKVLPELLDVMKYNTFKQYITPFAIIMEEVIQRLHKNEKIIEELRKEKTMSEHQVKALQGKLHKVTRKLKSETVTQQLHKEGVKNIRGWTVQKAKDGYYRLHRKIKGRVYSIYLGKICDTEMAMNKIGVKESALGVK